MLVVVIACSVLAHSQVTTQTARRLAPTTFANLGAPANGEVRYCSNCQATSPCTSGGTGADAFRIAGAWNCSNGGSGTGDVAGPASAVNGNLASFSGTTGKLIADSGIVPANVALLSGTTQFTATQTISKNAATIPAGETGTLLNLGNADTVATRIQATGFAAQGFFSARRANGTAALPTNLVNNDQIGAFNFGGYMATGYSGVQASLGGFASGTWSDTSNPTYLLFRTTPAASTTLTTALTLGSDQSATFAGLGTFNAGTTVSGSAFTMSGNISGSGIFSTSGIRIKGIAATFNDTTSSGTVAAAYTDTLGGNTLTATGATTITDYFTVNMMPPTASTNITLTRKHTLGILDSTSASSSITGGLVVAAVYGTTGTSVGIGGGNINAGGSIIAAGAVTSSGTVQGVSVDATTVLEILSKSGFRSASDGVMRVTNQSANGFTRFNFGLDTNSGAAIGFDAVNGFTLQSAAGTATWNDASTANSGTVASRYMFGLAAPTLTSTGTSVTYTNAATIDIAGAPTASTNVTITNTAMALRVRAGKALLGGTVFIPSITASAGLQTAVLCQSSGGEMIADSVACLASSGRFKEGVLPLQSGLNEIMSLSPVTFFYKPEGIFAKNVNFRRERIGLIAEDVAKVDPRLVGYEADGVTPRTVAYDQLTPMLINAIKDQQKQIDTLKAEVNKLRKE